MQKSIYITSLYVTGWSFITPSTILDVAFVPWHIEILYKIRKARKTMLQFKCQISFSLIFFIQMCVEVRVLESFLVTIALT